MIDFHVYIGHGPGLGISGGMLPAEAMACAKQAGYQALGLILRTDGSNLYGLSTLEHLAGQIDQLAIYLDIQAILGVELVNVPSALLPQRVEQARRAGAKLVLVQGDTPGGLPGVNAAFSAVEACADIISNPGLIDEPSAAFAAERSVALEISGNPQQAFCNAHVAKMAEKCGCPLITGGGIRNPHDILTRQGWDYICKGANINLELMNKIQQDCRMLLNRLSGRSSTAPCSKPNL